jgi:hypothetical protein
MKSIGKSKILKLWVIAAVFTLAACSDEGSKSKPSPNTYHNPLECESQHLPVGIQGNSACPYLGEFDDHLGYQSFAIQYNVGVGFKIDFGWEYNDMCPQDGQLPVFEFGKFSHCSSVNPNFAGPFKGYTNRSMGECAGEQYSPEITGCLDDIRLMPVGY